MFAFSLCTIETRNCTGYRKLSTILTDRYEFINTRRKLTSFISLQGFRRQRDQRAAEGNIFKSVFLAKFVSEPTYCFFVYYFI